MCDQFRFRNAFNSFGIQWPRLTTPCVIRPMHLVFYNQKDQPNNARFILSDRFLRQLTRPWTQNVSSTTYRYVKQVRAICREFILPLRDRLGLPSNRDGRTFDDSLGWLRLSTVPRKHAVGRRDFCGHTPDVLDKLFLPSRSHAPPGSEPAMTCTSPGPPMLAVHGAGSQPILYTRLSFGSFLARPDHSFVSVRSLQPWEDRPG